MKKADLLPVENKTFIKLVQLVGIVATVKLVDEFGGGAVYIPKSKDPLYLKRNLSIIKDRERGLSFKVLGEKYGIPTKTVKSIMRAYKNKARRR